MPERPSAEPHLSGDPVSNPDQAAKIEQLLLTGLDAYFAGQYDLAIGIWTRVLFLDRLHARARAYIDRARSALTERQRESEALLHQGVEAFRRGDRADARRLLEEALSLGAPPDEARTVLDRMRPGTPSDGRLSSDWSPVGPSPLSSSNVPSLESARDPLASRPRRWPGKALGGGALLACLIVALAANRFASRPGAPAPDVRGRTSGSGGRERMLALPALGELALTRARTQAAAGHVRDALATLVDVRPSDPAKAEVERYRAELQRQLLVLAPAMPDAGLPPDPPTGPR